MKRKQKCDKQGFKSDFSSLCLTFSLHLSYLKSTIVLYVRLNLLHRIKNQNVMLAESLCSTENLSSVPKSPSCGHESKLQKPFISVVLSHQRLSCMRLSICNAPYEVNYPEINQISRLVTSTFVACSKSNFTLRSQTFTLGSYLSRKQEEKQFATHFQFKFETIKSA